MIAERHLQCFACPVYNEFNSAPGKSSFSRFYKIRIFILFFLVYINKLHVSEIFSGSEKGKCFETSVSVDNNPVTTSCLQNEEHKECIHVEVERKSIRRPPEMNCLREIRRCESDVWNGICLPAATMCEVARTTNSI